MESEQWRTIGINSASFRGFPAVLDEMLEQAGIRSKEIYQGRVQGSKNDGQAFVTLTIEADSRVPEFNRTHVQAREKGVTNAIQTAAIYALRGVHLQVSQRLEGTPYRYLPQALFS